LLLSAVVDVPFQAAPFRITRGDDSFTGPLGGLQLGFQGSGQAHVVQQQRGTGAHRFQ